MTQDQVAFWNGPAGETWVREQAERDAMLASYGEEAMRAARVAEGDSVLDVGCGCGTTTIALADRVGPRGRVVGVDVSAPMIGRARDRSRALPNVSFVEGDATRAPLEAGGFDVVFSRFGVMFFDDPVGAFAHLRRSIKKGGRVAFVCWRALRENPWAQIPLDAAKQVLAAAGVALPPPADPHAPGPFAFADGGRVRSILEKAGFASVDVRPFDSRATYGDALDSAAMHLTTMGPASRLLGDADPATVSRVAAIVHEAIAPFAGANGVAIPGAAWIVTATL